MEAIAIDRVQIRPLSDADGDGLARLIARVWAEYPGCVFDRAVEFPELDAPATHFQRAGGAGWVLVQEGAATLLGSVATAPKAGVPGAWELHKLYLDAELRGTGWAQRLIALAEDFARSRGADAMHLWSDTRFAAAHRFYAKQGYRQMPGDRVLDDLSRSREYAFQKVLDGLGRGQAA